VYDTAQNMLLCLWSSILFILQLLLKQSAEKQWRLTIVRVT